MAEQRLPVARSTHGSTGRDDYAFRPACGLHPHPTGMVVGARRLLRDTRGLTSVEYVVILCLIAIVGIIAWRSFGETVRAKVDGSSRTLATLGGGGGGTTVAGVAIPGRPTLGDVAGAAGGALGEARDAAGGVWSEGGFIGRGGSTGVGAVARGVADGIADAVGGAVEGVVGTARGVWGAVTSPRETARAVADAVTNPGDTARAAWDAARGVASRTWEAGRDLVGACASGDGYGCARGVTNVAAAVIPVGAAGTVARGAGAVRTATGVVGRTRVAVTSRTGRVLRRDGAGDYIDDLGESRVLREAPDGVTADDLLREGGDAREVVMTRDAEGRLRVRTADDDRAVTFPENERAIAHNHPGAADDPAWQVPSEADIDYMRENPGHHAIASERGVMVISERTRVGADTPTRVRMRDGTELTGRYSEVRNATRVDSRDVRITTDADGNLLIEPLPGSAHPDYLPITPIGRSRIGTEVVHDAERGWHVVDHNTGTVHRTTSGIAAETRPGTPGFNPSADP